MNKNERLLKELVNNLDLPKSAHEKAVERYQDLGAWLGRDDSRVVKHDPHIFPQGSFRLGIAIKPLSGDEEYDLDLACNLTSGISTNETSQQELKELVGLELESYRKARHIKVPLETKHRCWRLEYADSLKFHMDIVPCVPEDGSIKRSLASSMESYGINESLAQGISEKAVSITDDRLPNYTEISSDWLISNPEGYAEWFEDRMNKVGILKATNEAFQVDDVPIHNRKTPLQIAIQILKRHRDTMFKDNLDSKPISVIITTLAGRSYEGSSSLEEALHQVILGLKEFAHSNSDEVLNPVNPNENFADRWKMPAYKELNLKNNFHNWVDQVSKDFEFLLGSKDLDMISESLSNNLAISIESKDLETVLNIQEATEPQTKSILENLVHSEKLKWPVSPSVKKLNIKSVVQQNKSSPSAIAELSDYREVPKHLWIRFNVKNELDSDTEIYWKITNTGIEAKQDNCLRGKYFLGNKVHKESTLYKGAHWVEAVAINRGFCVARSEPILVQIA